MTMAVSGFLALPLDVQNLAQQPNLQLLQKGNLLRVDHMTTKLAVGGSAQLQHSTAEVCWIQCLYLLWFLFYEPKMDQN